MGNLEDSGAEYMLQYDPCEDESQSVETFSTLDEKPEVTPEYGDQYSNEEIFPRGNEIAKCSMLSIASNFIVVSSKNQSKSNILWPM